MRFEKAIANGQWLTAGGSILEFASTVLFDIICRLTIQPTSLMCYSYLMKQCHMWHFQYARYSILILLVISHRRFKTTDTPSSVSKAAPDFCTVYVIAKGKISHVRAATGQPPAKIPPLNPMQHQASNISDSGGANFMRNHQSRGLLL